MYAYQRPQDNAIVAASPASTTTGSKMDPRRPPEYTLEVTADRANAREVVKGLLHTLFFHRLFTPLYPATHDVLDLTLPYISDSELEALLDARTTSLLRALDNSSASSQQHQQQQHHHTSPQYNNPNKQTAQPASSSSAKDGREAKASLQIHFLERKRRKSGWFVTKQDEETIWEIWNLEVTLSQTSNIGSGSGRGGIEASRQRRQMERDLQRAATKIVMICARDRAHIPPITTNEANPFPYAVLVNPPRSGEGWFR